MGSHWAALPLTEQTLIDDNPPPRPDRVPARLPVCVQRQSLEGKLLQAEMDLGCTVGTNLVGADTWAGARRPGDSPSWVTQSTREPWWQGPRPAGFSGPATL